MVLRIVAATLLWLITTALILLGVIGVVDLAIGDSGGGLVFVWLLALFTGTLGWAVLRGGQRQAAGGQGDVPLAGGGVTVAPGRAEGEPATVANPGFGFSGYLYQERCSQFPVTGALISLVILASSVAGLVVMGSSSFVSIALLAALGSVGYLGFSLADLPNGIVIGGGRFAVGVRGVPPAGRLWRRFAGPLDAIRTWEVLSPAEVRQINQSRRTGPGRQYLGDLRLFSRREFLRLVVDPAAVQASIPARIQSGYVVVPATRAGALWDGTILIGTRHAAALGAALEQALPGRRGPGIRSQAN